MLIITKKNFQDEELPHELFLARRQKAKINAFANNMLRDIKHSKRQLSKVIQSGDFLRALLGELAGPFKNVALSLAKDV